MADAIMRKFPLQLLGNTSAILGNYLLQKTICYYILSNTANCHAKTWWEGNFARMKYPMATLESQRVSEFLAELGSETCYRSFFRAYAPYISDTVDGDNILIDST